MPRAVAWPCHGEQCVQLTLPLCFWTCPTDRTQNPLHLRSKVRGTIRAKAGSVAETTAQPL